MSYRSKIIGLIAVVFAFVVAVTYFATVALVQTQYSKIEARDVEQNAGRAVDAATNRVDQLGVKLSDWSSWDDTYEFIQNHNEAYKISNLQNGSLMNLGISFMVFINAQQQVVVAKGVDVESGKDLDVPAGLLAALKPGSALLAKDENGGKRGFLQTEAGTVFLASQPILHSDSSGPARGTLVFAQFLSKAEIAKLASLTHLNLNYYPLTGTLPSDVAAARGRATAQTPATTVISDAQIAGYRLINDVYGHPILIARVMLPRDDFQQARVTLRYYLAIVLLVSLIGLVAAIYTTNQIVRRDRTIQLKNEFFSMASHELRTPLTAIRGNSQMINDYYGAKNDKNLTELAGDIHESSERLIKLVTNFLDAARLESGKLPLSVTPLDLKDPVGVVVKQLEGLAAEKKLSVRSEVPADLSRVLADPERVQQVVYNLAGNAMKFTETGGVTIRAVQRGGVVVVMVSDTGRGMTAEEQKLLFKKFQQTRSADAANGSGLGLYISKMLVEHMGGRLWVESSAEGKGTTLAFGLPLA